MRRHVRASAARPAARNFRAGSAPWRRAFDVARRAAKRRVAHRLGGGGDGAQLIAFVRPNRVVRACAIAAAGEPVGGRQPLRARQRFAQQPQQHARTFGERRLRHIREQQSPAPFGRRALARRCAPHAAQNPAARSSDQMTNGHQHADQRITGVGDELRDALAGLELPAPLFEPAGVVVVLAILELVLEPAFEALPTRTPCSPWSPRSASTGSSGRASGASRRAAPVARLPHELGKRPQAFGGDFFAPLAHR